MDPGNRRLILLAVTALAVLVLCPAVLDDGSDAAAVDQGLVDDYGYADYIISQSGRSMVQIAHKVPNDSQQGYSWEVRTVSQGSSLNLTRLSELSGELTVVMVGGSLGDLVLIQVDALDDSVPVDVRFEMHGGSLTDLNVLVVPSNLDSGLENSYTLMFSPLGDVELRLLDGSIGDLVPTEDMVSADSMSIEVGDGMTVDRMMTSGSNGRYGSVSVLLTGGSVGYMSNERSVVGSMSYDFQSGDVDYFSVGADTENGGNAHLSDLNTFYVQGDVHVHIDETVGIRQAIMGGGILDIPSVLWNGDSPQGTGSSNVEIDAHGTVFYPDTCFLTSNRSQGNVYQFSLYTFDGTPRTKSISTDCLNYTSSRLPVYGEGGVWSSASDMTVGVGQYLYVDASLMVSAGSTLTVEMGGRLVTTGQTVLVGVLQNNGEVVNTGIIEKREGGHISGIEPTGDGYVAYCINLSPSDGAIDVMASDDDTVVLRTEGTVYISRISVLLENGDMEVTITVPETLYVGGDEFVISLREVQGDDGSYELRIMGIDENVLGSLRIEVTVPCDIPSDSSCYVYLHDRVSGESESMEIVDRSYGEVAFVASGNGTYFLSTVSPEGIDGSGIGENLINIILAVVIVVVGTGVVYILLKRD